MSPRRIHRSEHTRQPPTAPPVIVCPMCDFPLTYQQSVLAGPMPRERWDQFVCRRCRLAFEYRHRTRELKRTGAAFKNGIKLCSSALRTVQTRVDVDGTPSQEQRRQVFRLLTVGPC